MKANLEAPNMKNADFLINEKDPSNIDDFLVNNTNSGFSNLIPCDKASDQGYNKFFLVNGEKKSIFTQPLDSDSSIQLHPESDYQLVAQSTESQHEISIIKIEGNQENQN